MFEVKRGFPYLDDHVKPFYNRIFDNVGITCQCPSFPTGFWGTEITEGTPTGEILINIRDDNY